MLITTGRIENGRTDNGNPPDISHIITEDDTPVSSLFSEKQHRLLTSPLYISWRPGHPFLACSNVGIFHELHEPAIVADMFLSMDVRRPDDLWEKRHRSYFVWEYGKPPEVAVDIFVDITREEADEKRLAYAKIGVSYYYLISVILTGRGRPVCLPSPGCDMSGSGGHVPARTGQSHRTAPAISRLPESLRSGTTSSSILCIWFSRRC